MRILGIDYGERRIGLSLSDPLGIIASAFATLERTGGESDFEYFGKVIADNGIKTAVVGLPKNMDGTEGLSAQKAREFGEILVTRFGIKVVYKDERLTSVSANKLLDEDGMHWKKRNKVVDKIAAQIILQSYLDAGGK